MLNFLKQVTLFITVNLAIGWFKYFFLIVNIIPLILYLFFDFSAASLITYFLVETLVYCFINIIYLNLLDLPYILVKILLVIICLGFIMLSVYFIPLWNKDEPSDSTKVAFWNYTALLFSFYTVNFFTVGVKYYDWEEKILKRDVIFKFGILAVVVICGTFLSKYINNDLAFLISMIGVKTLIDLATLQKSQMKRNAVDNLASKIKRNKKKKEFER